MTPSATPLYDPELAALLDADPTVDRTSFTADTMITRRADSDTPIEELCEPRELVHSEVTIPSLDGHDVVVSIIKRRDHAGTGPGILHTHSGGMVIGTRFTGMLLMVDWVARFDAVVVSPEYRLAPEHQDPAAIEDCYAALIYLTENAADLGVDPACIVVSGQSAGGGLAAGLALLSRDRGGPALAGQMLMCPMLDERNTLESTHQFVNLGLWDRDSNEFGWNSLLGERRHTDAVTQYASPALASDLSDLPPTFIDVGSMEIFRDENVDFARRLWSIGADAELHVWAGGFHGFEVAYPDAAISRRCIAARTDWMARILGFT